MTNDSITSVTTAPYLLHAEWREMAYMAEGGHHRVTGSARRIVYGFTCLVSGPAWVKGKRTESIRFEQMQVSP